MIDVIPGDVSVSLDGAEIDNVDIVDKSIRLTRLIPKEYEITLKKDGYYDWSARTYVGPSDSVFFRNVRLFRDENLPIFIGNADSVVPNRKFTATTTSELIKNQSLKIKQDTDRGVLKIEVDKSGNDIELGVVPHAEYEFYDSPDNWIVFRDRSARTLYVYEMPEEGSTGRKYAIPDVYGFDWSKDERFLMYHNNFELWTLDVLTGRQNLITRRSSGIDYAIWYPSGNYVIYYSGDVVRIREINFYGETTVSYNLAKLPNVSDMRVDPEGKDLYLRADVGNKDGWFIRKMQ